MRKQIIFLVATLFFSFSSFSQSKFVPYFSVSDEILSKCNKMMEVPYTVYNGGKEESGNHSFFLYFENAVFDSIKIVDSIQYVLSMEECVLIDSVIVRHKIRLKSGKIFVLNSNGSVMNPTPFDDVKFASYTLEAYDGIDNYCLINCFAGFRQEKEIYCGFHENDSLSPFVKASTIHNFPIMVQQNGKWGLLSLDGKLIAEIKYDRLEFVSYPYQILMYTGSEIVKKFEF